MQAQPGGLHHRAKGRGDFCCECREIGALQGGVAAARLQSTEVQQGVDQLEHADLVAVDHAQGFAAQRWICTGKRFLGGAEHEGEGGA